MSESTSAVVEFELDCSTIDEAPFDRALYSGAAYAGGLYWRVACTPNDADSFVSLYLELMSQAEDVTAVFDAVVTDSGQAAGPSRFSRHRTTCVYSNPPRPGEYVLSGFPRLVHHGDVRDYAGDDGRVTILCAVSVVADGGASRPTPMDELPPFPTTKGIAAPPPDMGDHLGCLLDSADFTDVSFVVGDDDDGNAPPLRAHRALLAAHSRVLRAALCRHGMEGNTYAAPARIITVRDMDAGTFRTMLRFMYTDSLPAGLGDGDGDGRALRSLLAAADRYGLDRLKLLCARRLLDKMSVATVAALLDCAETHHCPELKAKCVDFVVADENFRQVMLTNSFRELLRKYPSILAETRDTQ